DLTVNLGRSLAGKRVLLMGAGGAAQGVLGPLLAGKPSRLVIANRTVEKSRALAKRFGAAGGSFREFQKEQFDFLINATSAGMSGEAAPIGARPLAAVGLAER